MDVRALEREDLARIREIRYHPEVSRWMIGLDIPRCAEAQEAWYEHILVEEKMFFVVCHEDKVVGYVQIGNVDWQHRSAEVGFAIDPQFQGMGLGTEAVRWALGFVLGTLGLHRVSLEVLADNEKAIRVYGKCGFQTEGVLREQCWKDGRFQDVVIMGIISVL